MLKRVLKPLPRMVLRAAHNQPVKFTGQTPTSFVPDGWANARTPVDVTSKWFFGIRMVVILTVGFWAPWIVVEYQMNKAFNQK